MKTKLSQTLSFPILRYWAWGKTKFSASGYHVEGSPESNRCAQLGEGDEYGKKRHQPKQTLVLSIDPCSAQHPMQQADCETPI